MSSPFPQSTDPSGLDSFVRILRFRVQLFAAVLFLFFLSPGEQFSQTRPASDCEQKKSEEKKMIVKMKNNFYKVPVEAVTRLKEAHETAEAENGKKSTTCIY